MLKGRVLELEAVVAVLGLFLAKVLTMLVDGVDVALVGDEYEEEK
jgi:hypothetical protein